MDNPNLSPEQSAREMLDRMEVDRALNMTSGDVIELANLIADYRYMRKCLREIRISSGTVLDNTNHSAFPEPGSYMSRHEMGS